MRVQKVAMPSGSLSWTVVDDDFAVIGPAERYLSYLQAIERSPNTVRAYAHSLALWWELQGLRGREWDAAGGGGRRGVRPVAAGSG